jgi:GNAT superfamily N-acetyltransferase
VAATILRADLDRPDDREAITELARAAARQPAVSFSPAGLVGELASRPGREITAWLAREGPPADGDAATDAPARAVGLVALSRTRGGWSIPWLLVHPDVRRHGVGRLLVAHAIEHARSRGAAGITADSLSSWPAAVAFWQAVGFTRR